MPDDQTLRRQLADDQREEQHARQARKSAVNQLAFIAVFLWVFVAPIELAHLCRKLGLGDNAVEALELVFCFWNRLD